MPKPSEATVSEPAETDYDIFETEEFICRLDALLVRDRRFVKNKLKNYVYPQLRQEPFFGTNIAKLRGYNTDTWRYRIGRFRLFYHIDIRENVVYLLSPDQRNNGYR